MEMLQLHGLRPWISVRTPKMSQSSSKRKSRRYPWRCISISSLYVDNLSKNDIENWRKSSVMTRRNMEPSSKLCNSSNLNKHADILKVFGAKLVMASLWSFFLVRLIRLNSKCTLMKVVEESFYHAARSFAASSSPFACMSNSLNKPLSLHLDVSLPSLQDIKWGLARLVYLFNIQLERNVATFFVVLLVACFSFVLIGGFLFYKFRGSTQSLEDCFWEAWACLCSSSTHLKV